MDTNLLRSWLGLPPGVWPPGDRELLGLPAGPVDAAAVERRAMQLMGALRPHQLRHPELVTEGMNRVAQAMLAVTAFGGAVAQPPPAPPPVPPKAPTAPARPARPAFEPIVLEPPKAEALPVPTAPTAEVVRGPEVLEAEVFDALPAAELPVAAIPDRTPAIERKQVAVEEADPIELPVADVGVQQAERRDAYRELAAFRAVMRTWEQLLPFIGDPSESLPTAGQICEFLEAIYAFRELEQHPGYPPGLFDDVVPALSSVLRQPLVLAVFRSLTPTQRRNLAREWAVGRATFRNQYEVLREKLHATRPRKNFARRTDEFVAAFAWNPEWILVLASMIFLGIAWLRASRAAE